MALEGDAWSDDIRRSSWESTMEEGGRQYDGYNLAEPFVNVRVRGGDQLSYTRCCNGRS